MSSGLVFTVNEAASYLGRSPAFVRSLVHARAIDARRIGNRFYIPKASLDVWLMPADTPKVNPTAPPVVPGRLVRDKSERRSMLGTLKGATAVY